MSAFIVSNTLKNFLKGLLTLHGVEAPKTHDLRRLIQLSKSFAPALIPFIDQSDLLTTHGVQTRYPDDFRLIDSTEMNEMITLARQLGEILNTALQK